MTKIILSLLIAKNMTRIILAAMNSISCHKFIHSKMLPFTMKLPFVAKNMVRIIFQQDMTLCHELYFLPQNYLL